MQDMCHSANLSKMKERKAVEVVLVEGKVRLTHVRNCSHDRENRVAADLENVENKNEAEPAGMTYDSDLPDFYFLRQSTIHANDQPDLAQCSRSHGRHSLSVPVVSAVKGVFDCAVPILHHCTSQNL
jgi:hypothetical protein